MTKLTESEKKSVRDNTIAQLEAIVAQLGPCATMPRKYWAEYAERLANAGKRDDEVTPNDITSLLATKGHLIEPLNLSGAYSILLSGVIIAELKEKYKAEWPKGE